MLRYIAFENLINFKDKQCLEFHDGVNFLVGANSTGKSSILELIRRCHSVNLSSSVTNLLDEDKTGYVISRYEGLSDVLGKNDNFKTDEVTLCSFQEREGKSMIIYKCICFRAMVNMEIYVAASKYETNEGNQEMKKRFLLKNVNGDWVGDFISQYFPIKEMNENPHKRIKGSHDIRKDVTQSEASTSNIQRLNNQTECRFLEYIKETLEESGPHIEISNETCEHLLEKLQSSFAHVFPVRSIGPLQWINGNSVSALDASENYKNAQIRAEILWELLPPKEQQEGLKNSKSLEYRYIDENEPSLFKRVTYPMEYEFLKDTKEEKIEVIHKNDPSSSQRQFELIKTPEGIIEAKQATLIFSHKKFKTICYEDIERGMHNQMIENMNNFVLKEITGKTVIIVTHNPSFINGWTFGRTHVCTRQKWQEDSEIQTKRKSFVNVVRKVPVKYAAKYGVHHEMKKCLFSARVLLIEGKTELHILRALFDYILREKEALVILRRELGQWRQSKEEFDDNVLRAFASIQFVSANSKMEFKDAEEFCRNIKIVVHVLIDNDDIKNERKEGKLDSDEDLKAYKKKQKKPTKENEFIWENGTIEDALRADCPQTITKILGSNIEGCKNSEWEKTHKGALKKKINKGLINDRYKELFEELFQKINQSMKETSEFFAFFKFITVQDKYTASSNNSK